jgi:Asp-tRNA(Asn)/Glu-tRNA(Gln) amidotransferase A subunit family amidase
MHVQQMFCADALEIAEKLERDYSDGQPKPALYGIPISVKEQFEVL